MLKNNKPNKRVNIYAFMMKSIIKTTTKITIIKTNVYTPKKPTTSVAAGATTTTNKIER